MPATIVQRGGDKDGVCWRMNIPPLLVHQSETWLEGGLVVTASWSDGTGRAGIQAENSEVLLAGLLAVAVTTQLAGTDTGNVIEKLVEHRLPSVRLDCPR